MELPQAIARFLTVLEENGYEAYLVGGCVRDILLQRTPHDYDITTNATPMQLLSLFRERGFRTSAIGGVCGTVKVEEGEWEAEITPYRKERGYSDFRRPDEVVFVSDIKEDLARRDFTINAMALSRDGTLVDLFGGKDDLADGILRCVGNPIERFTEDALRILRALRFLARFSLHAEPQTKEAMFTLRDTLKHLSAERVFSEIKLLLETPAPLAVITEYQTVLQIVLPEFNPFTRLDFLPQKDMVRLFSLLYTYDAAHFTKTVRSLKASSAEKDILYGLFSLHKEKIPETDFADFTLAARRTLARYGAELIDGYLDFLETDKKAFTTYLASGIWKITQLAVDGNDLMQCGITGAALGNALATLLDDVMAEQIQNTKEALLSHSKGRGQC